MGRLEGAALYGSSKSKPNLAPVPDAHYPGTGTVEGGRAQYARLCSFSAELRIRNRQVHRMVLQRAQVDV